MQPGEGFQSRGLTAEDEHLEQPVVGGVPPILRAAVALGNPHRPPPLTDDVVKVAREVERKAVELAEAGRTLDTKHPIGPADVDNQRMAHEVGTERNLSGGATAVEQRRLQQGGIEYDVTVVRDEEVGRVGRKPLQSFAGEAVDAPCDDLSVERVHHLALKGFDRV